MAGISYGLFRGVLGVADPRTGIWVAGALQNKARGLWGGSPWVKANFNTWPEARYVIQSVFQPFAIGQSPRKLRKGQPLSGKC